MALGTTLAADGSGAAKSKSSKAKGQAAAATASALATLTVQQANVTVKAAKKSRFVAARDGQALKQGDAIKTDVAGRAQINYSDGSLTRLAPETEYRITRLTSKRGGRQTQGALTVGQTWNRAAKVAETGSFEVKSGGTTAAVEGTAFVFSCSIVTAQKVCQVIAVVDSTRVTTQGGGLALLTPATILLVTDGTPGTVTQLTYEDLIKLPFVVENVNLDELQGKGLGLDAELPPPPPPPALPPDDAATGTGGTGTGGTGTGGTGDAPSDDTTPPGPPPPPPPPPDNVAPSITLTTPPNGAVYARNAVVIAEFSCSDTGGSGVATCVASVPSGSAIDTTSLGVQSFSVASSDSAGNTAFVTHGYTVVDQAGPVVTIASPADGATFAAGADVFADFSCEDEGGGSGIATCEGDLADGAQIDTSMPGEFSFTVTATDNAGNTTTVTHTYTVEGAVGTIVVPTGFTVQFSDFVFSACNNLSWGYQIDDGPPVVAFSATPGCGVAGAPSTIIGAFDTDVAVQVFLDDDTCGERFFMDGSHGLVTPNSPTRWTVAITDAGGACEAPPEVPRPPADGVGNLNLSVTLLPPEASSE